MTFWGRITCGYGRLALYVKGSAGAFRSNIVDYIQVAEFMLLTHQEEVSELDFLSF